MKSETKNIIVVGSVLVLAIVFLIATLSYNPVEPIVHNTQEYGQFNSIDEIKAFLEENSNDNYYGGGFGLARTFSETSALDAAAPQVGANMAKAEVVGQQAGDYSETNIQVEGVDEPDIVKNDGKYIYTLSGNKVVIVDAFPADGMEVVEEIEFNDENVRNLFVNGDKLVVFSDKYEYVDTGLRCGDIMAWRVRCGGYSKQDTFAYVYDISDRDDAKLDETFSLSGYHVDARMIGDVVYLVASKDVYRNYFDLPSYAIGGVEKTIDASEISYFGQKDESFTFNTIAAIDLSNNDFESETFLMGASRNLFVSKDNIYLTYEKRLSQEAIMEGYLEEILLPSLPESVADEIVDVWNDDDLEMREKQEEIDEIFGDYLATLESQELFEFQEDLEDRAFEFFKEVQREQEKTVIHRIEVDGLEIDYEAMGEVPGRVLNQFSMDEYEGTFRIATTTGGWRADDNENNLYVLDLDLEIIGEVEGLAEGERIYSARFMGEKAYMVTFRQVDPLFAIDLSDPENPEVLGELKITGYSGYLHPYDENHLLGIGQEASEQGRTQGVKISLFDVSDMTNPIEIDKYHVDEGRWSSTEAEHDYKAVLFDKGKNLLVIPLSYNKEVEVAGQSWPRYEHWQGAYVFDVSLEGIDLRGSVVHELDQDGEEYWRGGSDYVRRSLYMDDVLYTVSNMKIKASELADLDFVSEAELPFDGYGGPIYYGRSGGGIEPAIVE